MYSRCASLSLHHLLQGVSWCRIMKKWRAQFGYGGKCRNLGYFDDPADAVSTTLCCTRLCVLNKPIAVSCLSVRWPAKDACLQTALRSQ